MVRRIILSFTVSLLCSTMLHSQENFRISSKNEKTVSPFKLNEYIFIHNFFADAFYMTGLHKQLDTQNMYTILNYVRTKLSAENPVGLEVKQKDGSAAKITFSIKEHPKDGTVLIMYTNFNPKNGTYDDKAKDNLVRWYFLKGDRVVYRKDIYSAETEHKLIAEGKRTELISNYLFDEVKNNDNKAKTLINHILSDEKSSKTDVLYALLYEEEYHLLNKEYALANDAYYKLKNHFDTYGGKEIPANYILLPKMALAELEIMELAVKGSSK